MRDQDEPTTPAPDPDRDALTVELLRAGDPEGTPVSSVAVSVTSADSLPASSRNFARTVFSPSPVASVTAFVRANVSQASVSSVPSIETCICAAPFASRASVVVTDER